MTAALSPCGCNAIRGLIPRPQSPDLAGLGSRNLYNNLRHATFTCAGAVDSRNLHGPTCNPSSPLPFSSRLTRNTHFEISMFYIHKGHQKLQRTPRGGGFSLQWTASSHAGMSDISPQRMLDKVVPRCGWEVWSPMLIDQAVESASQHGAEQCKRRVDHCNGQLLALKLLITMQW
jgi:hypothetical protein